MGEPQLPRTGNPRHKRRGRDCRRCFSEVGRSPTHEESEPAPKLTPSLSQSAHLCHLWEGDPSRHEREEKDLQPRMQRLVAISVKRWGGAAQDPRVSGGCYSHILGDVYMAFVVSSYEGDDG
jgi:hypothetical protein